MNMRYFPHPHHRNADYATQKSQWIIPTCDEHSCYQNAVDGKWLGNGVYFGLHVVNQIPQQLGTSAYPMSHSLHIAKFVGDENGDWHGYPVAPWLSPKDKPSTNVLLAWHNAGLINTAKIGKIKRGKRCAL